MRRLRHGDRRRLLAWLALVVPLAVVGAGVGGRLHRTEPIVPSTASARANALNERFFGPSQGLLVLLEGPPRALRADGPRIARRLARVPDVRVLDPWTVPVPELRPAPSRAILLLSVAQPFETASDRTAPRLRTLLKTAVRPPLAAHLSGYADVAEAIHATTVSAVERAELIAAPVLLLVLLLVLGTPLAAALPLFLGGCVAGAGAGIVDVINRLTPLDATALNLCSMMGLALGVYYSLLIVTRFRRVLADGLDVPEAAARAARHAGRTVQFAAAALALALLGALVLVPGNILRSAVVGGLVAVALSVIGATIALPPLLRFAGHGIDRARVVPAGSQSGRWSAVALRALTRPALAGGVVVVVMLAISAPALSMRTGPPSPLVLPTDSAARKDYDAINRGVGGGRIIPYVVTVVGRSSGAPTSRQLAVLARFQRTLASDRQTLFVLGPASAAGGHLSAAAMRQASAWLVSGGIGTSAAQLVVFPRGNGTAPSHAYGSRLATLAAAFARRAGATVAIGGPGMTLTDLVQAAKQNRPLLIIVLLALTYVALVPILRSVVVPLIAVVLNAMSVAAAFGVATLAFGGSAPLGGPGFVDGLGVDIIFSVVLALSIDYEIFLLHRIREGYDLTGTVDGAIAFGLEQTAGVITGAAAIMIAVFVVFAISAVITMSELGVALAVAVALDATLVRLVLLPAALRLAGPSAWKRPALTRRRLAASIGGR